MWSTSTQKEQFYSKLKTVKKSNNRLISCEHLELVKKYLSDQHQQNFNCDDDMDDVVAKRIKNKIKRSKFTLVNMGHETNVVYTWKKKSGDNELVRETENSGNEVGNSSLKCLSQVSVCPYTLELYTY